LEVVFDNYLTWSDNEDKDDLLFKQSDFSDDEEVTPGVELTGCETPTEPEPDLRRMMTEVDDAIDAIHAALPNLYSEPFHLLLCIISSIADSATKTVTKIGVNSREWILLSSLQGSIALLYVLGFVWDSASWNLTLGPKPILETFNYAKRRLHPSVCKPSEDADTSNPVAPVEGVEVTNRTPSRESTREMYNGFTEHCCDPGNYNSSATESLWNLRTLNELSASREWSVVFRFAHANWSKTVAGEQLSLLANALRWIMETNKELSEANGFLADSLVTRMEKVCAANTLRLLERNKPRTTGGISLHRLNHLITSAMETVTSDKVGFESTGDDAIDALIDEEMTSRMPRKKMTLPRLLRHTATELKPHHVLPRQSRMRLGKLWSYGDTSVISKQNSLGAAKNGFGKADGGPPSSSKNMKRSINGAKTTMG
jgi:hypothetical protein